MHVEVIRGGANKANALQVLCRTLVVDVTDVMAFGDGDNDAELLAAAGKGIAMVRRRNAHHIELLCSCS